jgi:hypothetical protein
MAFNAQKFRSTLVYETTSPVKSIQMHVGELRRIDLEHEKVERFWRNLGIAGVALSIALMIGAIISSEWKSGFAVVLGVLLVLSIIATVVFFVVMAVYGRLNYENRRYELLSQVINLLGKDMAPDAIVDVKLDLKKPDHKSKFQRKGQVGEWSVKYYVDPWLQLHAKLLDGAAFTLVVTELFQARSKWKRNPRGKMKHKSKTKTATQASLTVKVKPRKYPLLESLSADVAGAVQLPEWVELKGIQSTATTLSLKVGAKCEWDIKRSSGPSSGRDGTQMVAMMFLSIYQVLNLAKAMAKGSAGGSGAAAGSPPPTPGTSATGNAPKKDPFAFG